MAPIDNSFSGTGVAVASAWEDVDVWITDAVVVVADSDVDCLETELTDVVLGVVDTLDVGVEVEIDVDVELVWTVLVVTLEVDVDEEMEAAVEMLETGALT